MKRSSFTISIFPRKGKSKKDQNLKLYIRITVNGMRAEVSLNRTIPEKNWDTVKRIPTGKGSKQLLQYIEEKKALVFQAEQELTREGKLVTAK